MKKKTDFTVFHMRQSFLLFFVFVIASFIPLIGGLVSFVAFCHLIFLAWKAYSGEKFKISYIYDTSVRMTQEF